MKRKVLLFGVVLAMSVFGITRLVAAEYHGTVPTERLLASGDFDDPDNCIPFTIENDPDQDGWCNANGSDLCPNVPGPNCGCPAAWMAPDCTWLVDPDDPTKMNDSEAPVGGGLLLLLGSALAYGATVKRRNKNINLKENNN